MSFLSRMFAQGSGSNPFAPSDILREKPELPPPTPPLPVNRREPRTPIYDMFSQEPKEPQNVVFQDILPPVEQAKLAQRAAEVQSRERFAADKLASQEALKGRQLDINQQRANIYDFKAKNPNLRLSVGQDGITRAFNPITGEMTELGRTGMSQEELAGLDQQHSLERIGAQSDSARALQELRHRNVLEQIGARGDESAELAELRALLTRERPQLATQQKAGVQLRYNKLINEKPEWKDFVRLNPNTGMPEIKEGSSGFFGMGAKKLDDKTRKEILAYLYPETPETTPIKTDKIDKKEEDEGDDIDKLINLATGGKPPTTKKN